ncbi:hypothetical protein ACFWA4_34520 [Streptomyces sp. NPDC060011]|uniref:hypothetical protein n=1 Tax=Streptomyces sp. NPDC060011 TaxID=3347037 RepID=UPI0036C99983
MKKITALVVTASTTAALLSGAAPFAQARPGPVVPHPWDKRVHCTATDPDGRHIVTRFGTSGFGWNHFTHRHNIRHCSNLAAAIHGNVDRNDHHGRLEYDGIALETGRQVKFTVIVQYTRKTKDRLYDAGRGQKIGVINACCHNQRNNKCPAWMNP